MLIAKLREGRLLRVGTTVLQVLQAREGAALLDLVPLCGQARQERVRSGGSLQLGEATVNVSWARRGEARLAIDAPMSVFIEVRPTIPTRPA